MYHTNDFLLELNTHPSLIKLQQMETIYIKKSLIVENRCKGSNQYGIYSIGQNGNIASEPTFQCVEYSDCFQRYFCGGDCRQFKIKISDYSNKQRDQVFENNIFLEFQKPFKCTCCSYSRPEMSVYLTTPTSRSYIGKIIAPFTCSLRQMSIEAYDPDETLKFSIQDTCCQSIILCGGCCCSEKCKKGQVKVYDQDKMEQQPMKINAYNCFKSCILAINDKEFEFPKLSSISDKVLMIASIIMFDMTFLEYDPKRRRHIGNVN